MTRILALFLFPLIFSFNFSPMSQTIELGEPKKGTQFLIENDAASSIAVELTVKERFMDELGMETLKETKDVSIFPPQLIIPAGERRTIRVTFLSKDKLEKERNFRVIAEQLPLKVDGKTKDKTGIKMLMKYVAALYASPPGTHSDLKLLSQTSDGKELVLEVLNQGGRHQLITNPVLKFSSAGAKGEIKAAELPGFAGENVLAGQKRIFRIKTSRTIPKDSKLDLKIDD